MWYPRISLGTSWLDLVFLLLVCFSGFFVSWLSLFKYPDIPLFALVSQDTCMSRCSICLGLSWFGLVCWGMSVSRVSFFVS